MKSRVLDIFYRLINGEKIYIKYIAEKNKVSKRTISRDLNEIKNFLVENREVVGDLELKYNNKSKTYYLESENLLKPSELVFIIKILIESRSINKLELLNIIEKISKKTSKTDKEMLKNIIDKEIFNYISVKQDNENIINIVWDLSKSIDKKKKITIEYYKAKREKVSRTLKPIAILFSEYYFYLIAYRDDYDDYKPLFFRVDRIVHIVEHRETFNIEQQYDFDEGEIKKQIQFMTYGEFRHIKFEYTGISVQAILDKIPTATIVSKEENKIIIKANVYGRGINNYLLSQGGNIKVLEPPELIEELKEEIAKMNNFYFNVEES